MKPVGIYFVMTSPQGQSRGMDDDYDWYVREVASERASAAPTSRPPTTSLRDRLRSLVPVLRSRPGEASARRA